jgi:hypothetical protein
MSEQLKQNIDAKDVTRDKESGSTSQVTDPLHFCEYRNESNNICNTQWVQLYSTAAYFPSDPTDMDRDIYKSYFDNFTDQCKDSRLGGCIERAMRVLPPRKDFDRDEMMLWICNLESICRREAGLPPNQCRSSKLQKRWGYSDGYL